MVGLIGANGAGKSTLMNAIGGYVRSSGKKFAWRDVLKSVETGGPTLAGEATTP